MVLRASPPPQAVRPVPRGRPVEGHAPSPPGVSRVALSPVYRHAVVITPVALWVLIAHGPAYSSLALHPQRQRPSPPNCRVGVHIGRFEACSTFTRVTACRLAASPQRCICLEGFDGLVTSTVAPIATGWSDPVAGWELHPLRNNTFSRRTTWSDPFADPSSDLFADPEVARGASSTLRLLL